VFLPTSFSASLKRKRSPFRLKREKQLKRIPQIPQALVNEISLFWPLDILFFPKGVELADKQRQYLPVKNFDSIQTHGKRGSTEISILIFFEIKFVNFGHRYPSC